MIHDPSRRTLTPEEKLQGQSESGTTQEDLTGRCLYPEWLKKRGVVIQEFLIICFKITVIAGLMNLLKNIFKFITEPKWR